MVVYTSNMRHLFVVGDFVVVSHLKIFPLQLLGLAEKPMAQWPAQAALREKSSDEKHFK